MHRYPLKRAVPAWNPWEVLQIPRFWPKYEIFSREYTFRRHKAPAFHVVLTKVTDLREILMEIVPLIDRSKCYSLVKRFDQGTTIVLYRPDKIDWDEANDIIASLEDTVEWR